MKEFNSNGSTSQMPKNQEEVFDYSKVNKTNINDVINELEDLKEQFSKEQLDNLPNVVKEWIENGKDENYNCLIENLPNNKVVSIDELKLIQYVSFELLDYDLMRNYGYYIGGSYVTDKKVAVTKYLEILTGLTNSNVIHRRNLKRYDFSLNK